MTEAAVRQVRKLRKATKLTVTQIAQKVGHHRRTVLDVLEGRTWKWLE
jgi:hypothetical protein